MRVELAFAKLQAAGNGYIAIDGRGLGRDWGRIARVICDPHFGVGSDGLVVALESSVAPIRMRIFNSDGSEAEISGNGLRLFCKFVLDRGMVSAEAGSRAEAESRAAAESTAEAGSRVRAGSRAEAESRARAEGKAEAEEAAETAKGRADAEAKSLEVETGAGLRRVWPAFACGRMVSGRIAMGEPTLTASEIPVADSTLDPVGQVVGWPMRVGGRRLVVTCLSVGNPHAVAILDDEDVEDFPLAELGPEVQGHPAFPNRINFEIVNVIDRSNIRARIFERGEGETLSSGTGSTASAIAARLDGRVGDDIRVHLRGGILSVRWRGAGEAWLEGPVVEVFSGIWRGEP